MPGKDYVDIFMPFIVKILIMLMFSFIVCLSHILLQASEDEEKKV